jgi:hypothetical protein
MLNDKRKTLQVLDIGQTPLRCRFPITGQHQRTYITTNEQASQIYGFLTVKKMVILDRSGVLPEYHLEEVRG